MPLTTMQEYLAADLIRIEAVLFDTKNRFTLKHHEDHPEWPLSPVYFNLRTDQHPVPEKRGPLTPQTMEWIGIEHYYALQQLQWQFDFFADIPEAGKPFGDQIAKQLNLPDKRRLRLIKSTRPDGTRYISGIAKRPRGQAGNNVLLIDDAVAGAASKFEAIKTLEDLGYSIIGILVLVDRSEGGVERLRKAGYSVHAVMTLPDMLDYYVEKGLITPQLWVQVNEYLLVIRDFQAIS